jgi:hypothetical protein
VKGAGKMIETKDSASSTDSQWTEKEIKEELRRLFLGGDDWSKEACMGYFLKTCQRTNLDIKTTQTLAITLYHLFDELTVGDAKKFYYNECHAILSGRNHI